MRKSACLLQCPVRRSHHGVVCASFRFEALDVSNTGRITREDLERFFKQDSEKKQTRCKTMKWSQATIDRVKGYENTAMAKSKTRANTSKPPGADTRGPAASRAGTKKAPSLPPAVALLEPAKHSQEHSALQA